MVQASNLAGQIFSRLTVLAQGPRYANGHARWFCLCACGKTTLVEAGNLRSGRQRSCGCLNDELRGKARTTHGHTTNQFYNRQSPEYNTWQLMKSRCYYPKSNRYYRYGARGITVCRRWLDSFANFLADMGPKPSPRHSIDRINNDGNYEPTNCRWATTAEQRRNRSDSK